MLVRRRSIPAESLRAYAEQGGGVPPARFGTIADNGEYVIWEDNGEVRTATPDDYFNLTIYTIDGDNNVRNSNQDRPIDR